jgi:O-6-methylguanine DNA methyltransferase
MKTAFYPFASGYLKIGHTDAAVTLLMKTDAVDDANTQSDISHSAHGQICEYLDGKRKAFDFPLELRGTDFQKKVWHALCLIPFGETRTYAQVAHMIGSPKASRAVGLANSKNPIWIAVPCHRVVGANGKLTGYAGGLDMKQALLRLERGQAFSLEQSLPP